MMQYQGIEMHIFVLLINFIVAVPVSTRCSIPCKIFANIFLLLANVLLQKVDLLPLIPTLYTTLTNAAH